MCVIISHLEFMGIHLCCKWVKVEKYLCVFWYGLLFLGPIKFNFTGPYLGVVNNDAVVISAH